MNLIGIDIGRSTTRIALGDENGKIKKSVVCPTVAKNIYDNLILKIAEFSHKNIDAIAVGITNILSNKGIVDFNISRKKNTKLKNELKRKYKVPVILENDTAAAALGEAVLGAGKSENIMIYVGIGSGVGIVAVKNGAIFEGAYGKEAGHMVIEKGGLRCRCGGRGHLEAYVSGTAIKKRFGKELKDIKSKKIWTDVGKYLTKGLSNIVDAYSPGIIVLGGGVVNNNEAFLPIFKAIFYELLPERKTIKITKSKFGDKSGLVGALLLARKAAEKN